MKFSAFFGHPDKKPKTVKIQGNTRKEVLEAALAVQGKLPKGYVLVAIDHVEPKINVWLGVTGGWRPRETLVWSDED